MDLVVEDEVVVELKAINELEKIHEAQLLTYLRLAGMKLGLLLNFNVLLMKNGGLPLIEWVAPVARESAARCKPPCQGTLQVPPCTLNGFIPECRAYHEHRIA